MLTQLLPTTFLNIGTKNTSHWGDTSKPFFVTVGCSLTENSHIEYQQCWSSVLADMLGLEHVNLAFGGSCLEYQSEKINQVWNLLPQAKFCVWMQTYPTRTRSNLCFLGDHLRRRQHGLAYDDPKTFMRQSEIIIRHLDQNVLMTNCWGYDGAYKKILHSKFCNNQKFMPNTSEWLDRARDNLHAGPRTHQAIAESLHGHLVKNFRSWL